MTTSMEKQGRVSLLNSAGGWRVHMEDRSSWSGKTPLSQLLSPEQQHVLEPTVPAARSCPGSLLESGSWSWQGVLLLRRPRGGEVGEVLLMLITDGEELEVVMRSLKRLILPNGGSMF